MPDYTELTDAALAANKPVTQSMMRALRDNLLAVIGAGSGAPPVEMKALEQLYFSARRGDGFQNITNNQAVLYGTEELDPADCYNPATGRFTPTKPGIYRVTARLVCSSGSNSLTATALLFKNTTSIRQVPVTTATSIDVFFNTLVSLNGVDDFVLVGFNGISGAGSGIYGGDFAAELVKGL